MTQINSETLSQSQVEQRTGLSREVLRKWELRYGFPIPERGSRGQRLYSTNDILKLDLISRLLKNGIRASTLVSLDVDELQNKLDLISQQTFSRSLTPEVVAQAITGLMDSLEPSRNSRDPGLFLQAQLQQFGLECLVANLIPAFNLAVGEAWSAQRLSIAAEHNYTASLRQAVLRALPAPESAIKVPRVLLTTPPGELHCLGLLALHAQLSLQGAHVIDLDSQTPVSEILQMVVNCEVGVVAISASSFMSKNDLLLFVNSILDGLPKTCELWLGGSGCNALKLPENLKCIMFKDTTSAVRHWMSLAKAQGVRQHAETCPQ